MIRFTTRRRRGVKYAGKICDAELLAGDFAGTCAGAAVVDRDGGESGCGASGDLGTWSSDCGERGKTNAVQLFICRS